MELANNLKILVSTVKAVQISDGNGAGRDRKMGSSHLPRIVFSYPIPAP